MAQGADLFGEKRLVASNRVLENELASVFLTDNLELIASSTTVFIFLEERVEEELLKKISGKSKVEEHQAKLTGVDAPFNLFLITNALATRDRKKLWRLYQEALTSGEAEEEIFWKLVWQVKTLLLVQNLKTQPKTMKDFVWQKNRNALKNFKVGELANLSAQLVRLWHDTRLGLTDFDLGLEKLVLTI